MPARDEAAEAGTQCPALGGSKSPPLLALHRGPPGALQLLADARAVVGVSVALAHRLTTGLPMWTGNGIAGFEPHVAQAVAGMAYHAVTSSQ